jgi:peptide deformylase
MAATGYLSGALQHEADHLTGTLFMDRLKNMQELAEESEWEKLFEQQPGCQEGRIKFYDRK